MRLGVKEEDIPRWFHNAAQAGADAEDAITNVEYSVRNMLDCARPVDPLDMEGYNHGFEVILPTGCVQKGLRPHAVCKLGSVQTGPVRSLRPTYAIAVAHPFHASPLPLTVDERGATWRHMGSALSKQPL